MAPNHIRAELVRRGVTQTEVAHQLNLDPRTINTVIWGRGSSRRVAECIADILGKPMDVVFPAYAAN